MLAYDLAMATLLAVAALDVLQRLGFSTHARKTSFFAAAETVDGTSSSGVRTTRSFMIFSTA